MEMIKPGVILTGTCFIKKIYVPSSSLLQGKHLSLPHFASIFFAYLWSFRWLNYIVTLLRYFSFRLPHLNISTGPPSDELDKNSQRTWLSENLSHWNGYSHFRSGLNWWFKNQMSVIWSWTYFYNLHWNNYLYFKGLLYIWEEMIMWHCYTWPV